MTDYGQAFYGSEEIHKVLDKQTGIFFFTVCREWNSEHPLSFAHKDTLYKLRADHWFYNRDEFKRAKKPTCNDNLQVAKPLADYSDDELQAEIDRRKAQDDEITILARKVCADNTDDSILKNDLIAGKRDDTLVFRAAKAAIIAGMKLHRGRET